MKKLLFLFIAITSLSIIATTPRNYSQRCIRISPGANQLAKMGMSRKPHAILQESNRTKTNHQDLKMAHKIVKAQLNQFEQLRRHFSGKSTNLYPEEVAAFITKYKADQWTNEAITASLARKIIRLNTAIACFNHLLLTDIPSVISVANQHLLGQ